jgi:hypothetical protein
MASFFHTRGSLGSKATLRADATLVSFVLIAIFVIIFTLAQQKKFILGHWTKTGEVLISSLMVLVLIVTFLLYRILPAILYEVNQGEYASRKLYRVIAATALAFRALVALRGDRLIPKNMRFSMRCIFYTPFMGFICSP